jgi:membrane-anchored protein YejM (alkaline phosphatase superfamily)
METPPDDDLVTLKKINDTKINQRSFVYIHLLSTHTIGQKKQELKKFFPDKIGIGTDQKAALINNYDNGIVQADYSIKNIFEKLKRDNLLAKATVFILADHGELLGEDDRWSHGGSVHQTLITVPLLVYDTHKEWYNNLQTATLKDLGPTIIDRLNYPVPTCWEGRSLHQPAKDFEMEINSVVDCDFPYGLLSSKRGEIKLEIMNRKKEITKTLLRVKQDWEERK